MSYWQRVWRWRNVIESVAISALACCTVACFVPTLFLVSWEMLVTFSIATLIGFFFWPSTML